MAPGRRKMSSAADPGIDEVATDRGPKTVRRNDAGQVTSGHHEVGHFEHDKEHAGRDSQLGIKVFAGRAKRGRAKRFQRLVHGRKLPARGKGAVKALHSAKASGLDIDGTGLRFYPGYLDRARQAAVAAAVHHVLAAAPLFTPRMPKSGRPMSVRMSNCGALGWLTDARGYRYQPTHPDTGRPWPPVPEALLAIWRDVAHYPQPPEACLINFYGPAAKMGLHQDRDESDFDAPVVSLSLGDSCLFRVGGQTRSAPTRSFRLSSGDVVVLGGKARLAFHGVDRIYPGTSTLLAEGGRINLTLRRVTRPHVATFSPRRAAATAMQD